MKPVDVIALKRNHLARFVNQHGADGEISAVESMDNWVPRPKGKELKVLLSVLGESGITIKSTSFDALSLPKNTIIDFTDKEAVKKIISKIAFIEIKTANQKRVLTAEHFRLKMANTWMCKLIAEILCMPIDASRSFPRTLGTPP